MDEIITFKPLSIPDVERIVDLQMKEIQVRGEFKSGDVVTVDWVEGQGLQFRHDAPAPVSLGSTVAVAQ